MALQRDNLENEKLRLEIKRLNRPFYIKHFPALVTLLIGVGSLWLAYYTGFFDLKREKLAFEIAKFEDERDEILIAIDSLRNSLNAERIRSKKIEENNRKQREINEQMQDDYNKLSKEAQQIKESSISAENKISRYEGLVKRLEQSLSTANESLKKETNKNNGLVKKLQTYKNKIENYQKLNNQNCDAQEEKIARLEQEAYSCSITNKQLKDQIKSLLSKNTN